MCIRDRNKAILVRYSNEVLEKYQGNILFDALCKDDFISYLAKQNVGNAKKIFKITKMEGILTAYKSVSYTHLDVYKRQIQVIT